MNTYKPAAPGTALPRPLGQLSIEGVSFAPPGAERFVLQGLSFKITPGEMLGVIGPSGAGKSSLARLLVGVWRPNAGHVRLDGADVFSWDRAQFGRHVGYLPQDTELFAGTLRDNIARFRSDVTDEQVVAAATLADVHQLILRLPRGYETELTEGGHILSAGQRQRGRPAAGAGHDEGARRDHRGRLAQARHPARGRQDAGAARGPRGTVRAEGCGHGPLRPGRPPSPGGGRPMKFDLGPLRPIMGPVKPIDPHFDVGEPKPDEDLRRRMLRPVVIGAVVVAVFVVGMTIWAAFTQISSAAVAPAEVRVEANRKTLRHREGGVVAEILVREGQRVAANAPLLRFDAVQADSSVDVLQSQHDAVLAQSARFSAESAGARSLSFPADLTSRMSDPRVAGLIRDQQLLFTSRLQFFESQQGVLNQRIDQLATQMVGVQAQIDSIDEQVGYVREELAGYQTLY
ncbi:MAG TPA: ATP-binding cassette domain-containing protein, partial [Phenylobacterium sp.]|nr:ATP-binding cassette domain-containing protein [Phenylobacterium sp.]